MSWSIPALVITIIILARPFYETLWPGNAWKAIGISVGVAGFCFAVISWLAPRLYQKLFELVQLAELGGSDQAIELVWGMGLAGVLVLRSRDGGRCRERRRPPTNHSLAARMYRAGSRGRFGGLAPIRR